MKEWEEEKLFVVRAAYFNPTRDGGLKNES